MTTVVQDQATTDEKTPCPMKVGKTDPVKIEEPGMTAEAVWLAADSMIVAATKAGMEI